VPTDERCLFPEVGPIAGNYKLAGDMAFSLFTSQTINPTAARVETALFKD